MINTYFDVIGPIENFLQSREVEKHPKNHTFSTKIDRNISVGWEYQN